jgi:hypothetical protein
LAATVASIAAMKPGNEAIRLFCSSAITNRKSTFSQPRGPSSSPAVSSPGRSSFSAGSPVGSVRRASGGDSEVTPVTPGPSAVAPPPPSPPVHAVTSEHANHI